MGNHVIDKSKMGEVQVLWRGSGLDEELDQCAQSVFDATDGS